MAILILEKGKGKRKRSEEPIGSTESKKSHYLLELQARYQCDTHRTKFCYVMSNGTHRHLTNGDISWWSMAMVNKLNVFLKHRLILVYLFTGRRDPRFLITASSTSQNRRHAAS